VKLSFVKVQNATTIMDVENDTLQASDEKDLKISNPAWADAMSKILKTKKRKGIPLVLSKAKIISATDHIKIKQENDNTDETFEVVDKGGQKVTASVNVNEIKDEKPDLEKLEHKIPNRIRVNNVKFIIFFKKKILHCIFVRYCMGIVNFY